MRVESLVLGATLLALLAVSCADEPSTSALEADASRGPRSRLDAGRGDGSADVTDAAGVDSSQHDAAEPDAAARDAAGPDTGGRDATRSDAAHLDDAGSDVRVSDALPPDALPPDALPPDASLPDAGPACDAPRVHGIGAPLASRNACGTLSYGRYANQGQQDALHTLPDFSYAGYMKGGVALPEVPVVIELQPAAGDARARIQEAIDAVSARPLGADGFRGAVLLRRGTYQVGDSLWIRASGVVLRGEGQGRDGTVLTATRAAQHDFIRVEGQGSGLGEVAGTRTPITSPIVPVGSRTFEVESADAYSVGDVVGVLRTPNQAWIDALRMGQWGWTPQSYTIAHERTITAIDGRVVTVDIPIVDTLEAQYGGGALFLANVTGRIEQVGVEDLRLVSEYDGPTDEDHGWIAVRLARVANGWVRRVTAVHFGYAAVSVHGQSSFNTIEDCAMRAPVSQVTGSRRYSFNVSGGIGALFQRCYSEQARHDFVSGARTTGPNVWLDCFSTASTNDDGPHHRWATGLLFDNTAGHRLHVENRQSSGTGHGWSGAQTLFWNAMAGGIRCDAPRGAMNWAIGCVGPQNEGGWAPNEPFGWWESRNRPVEPRSLYLQQLMDRLGPEAVARVTLPAQRQGRIWGLLAGWAGEGRLEDASGARGGDPTCRTGVRSGSICCAAGCGSCGGSGCGSRPGGASACCTSQINDSGRTCAVVGPPCVLDPAFAPIGPVD